MTKFSNNGSGSATVIRCIESERQALLHFKKGLIDRANLLSSWTNEEEDCCRWSRVRCDKHTGHVVMLDLRPIMIGRDGIYALGGDGNFVWTGIGGELSSSLLELPYLSHLDLSNNWFSDIPEFMGSLSTLIYLDLSNNAIETFPYQLGNLSMLQYLDLSLNQLEGSIPDINEFPSLRELYLDHNHLDESFPKTFMHFSQLRILNVGNNRLVGSLPDLSKMSSLTELVVGNNELTGSLTDSIDKLRKLQILDVSSNRLNGVVIEAHLSNLSQLQKLDLSHNSLSLNVNFVWVPTFKLDVIKLSSWTVSVLCTITDSALSYLDLSENLLSGGLPNCWGQFRLKLPSSLKNCFRLTLLDLGGNKLTGKVSTWIGESLRNLIVLRLQLNEFYGNIPSTICHLKAIQVLDISFNSLSGTIPSCINNLTTMTQIQSSSNTISYRFDLSYSYWNGSKSLRLPNDSAYYVDYASVVWKGLEQEYGKTLGLLKIIDFSNNNLNGEIPEEVTRLLGVISLNLSMNNLTGAIPSRIGLLKLLESLDLSCNKLSGRIPTSLADLSFLGYLNLSKNQLTGKILLSTQLQSFDASAYMGNQRLCGPPLSDCSDDGKTQHPSGVDFRKI
eukprot:XP_025013468.1 receptor-like protein EIX2 [Ricinus communis]